jgi:hypothetical protein
MINFPSLLPHFPLASYIKMNELLLFIRFEDFFKARKLWKQYYFVHDFFYNVFLRDETTARDMARKTKYFSYKSEQTASISLLEGICGNKYQREIFLSLHACQV